MLLRKDVHPRGVVCVAAKHPKPCSAWHEPEEQRQSRDEHMRSLGGAEAHLRPEAPFSAISSSDRRGMARISSFARFISA